MALAARVNSTSKLGKVDFGAGAIIDLGRLSNALVRSLATKAKIRASTKSRRRGFSSWEPMLRDEKEWPLARNALDEVLPSQPRAREYTQGRWRAHDRSAGRTTGRPLRLRPE